MERGIKRKNEKRGDNKYAKVSTTVASTWRWSRFSSCSFLASSEILIMKTRQGDGSSWYSWPLLWLRAGFCLSRCHSSTFIFVRGRGDCGVEPGARSTVSKVVCTKDQKTLELTQKRAWNGLTAASKGRHGLTCRAQLSPKGRFLLKNHREQRGAAGVV